MDYSIILPSKPRVVQEEENKGVYEIDGLYAGYGHTLGNSLRRVILSSLPGTAVTSVKIDGVNHEFSNIEGVKEDVIMIILNIKQLYFKLETDEPQKISLSVKGDKKVTAGDFKLPSQIEILNTNAHIATVTGKDTSLNIEIVVEKGLGFVPREVLQKEKVEIGIIVPDAVFTPIRRVNYEVENMRVGERTDYNRLRFIIETDGTIAPREALEKSIEIVINQLRAIVGFEEEPAVEEILKEASQGEEREDILKKTEDENVLKTRVEDLDLSSRTLATLSNVSIRTVGGLARKKEEDLLAIENLGEKGIEEIKRALGNLGIILKE